MAIVADREIAPTALSYPEITECAALHVLLEAALIMRGDSRAVL
eukprot:IDg10998t1